jgi:hypothetical protein
MTVLDACATDTEMYAAGASRRDSASPCGPATIRLSSDADADVLLRIAVQLNYLNTVPSRFSLERRADRVHVLVGFDACALDTASLVCRKLAQLTSVLEVSMDPVAPAGAPNCS